MTTMDNDTTTSTTDTALVDPPPFGDDDPRTAFARAVATGRGVIGRVRSDQLDRPTPCDAFDVRTLLGHLAAVLRRVAVIGAGGSPFEVPDQLDGIDDDAWPATWTDAAHDVPRVWTDDVLDREVQVPWRAMSGREALGIYTNEVLVHTWDLAIATGQRVEWDELAVAVAMEAMRTEMPGEGRHEMFDEARAQMPVDTEDWPDPFLGVVSVPDDAAAIEHLVAFNGRHPGWTPPV